MSGRGKNNNTPWRNADSLMMPGSENFPVRRGRPQKIERMPDVSYPIELDMNAIAAAIARNRGGEQYRVCEGKECNTPLSRYTRATLCNTCQAKVRR
jgi:hypothetical protein